MPTNETAWQLDTKFALQAAQQKATKDKKMDTILAILIIAGAGFYLLTTAKNRLHKKSEGSMCNGCAGCGSSPASSDQNHTCSHNPSHEQKSPGPK